MQAEQLGASNAHQVSARWRITQHLFGVFWRTELHSLWQQARDTLHLLLNFTAWASMVTTGLSHAADSGDGLYRGYLHRETSGLTAYIQPGVACGHASFINGRECVPTSVRLRHPFYQQTLPT